MSTQNETVLTKEEDITAQINDIKPDIEKAMKWLVKSTESGNEYAGQLINNFNVDYKKPISNTVINLLVNLGTFIEEDNTRRRRNIYDKVDKKLQYMIKKKKEALGIKNENNSIELTE